MQEMGWMQTKSILPTLSLPFWGLTTHMRRSREMP